MHKTCHHLITGIAVAVVASTIGIAGVDAQGTQGTVARAPGERAAELRQRPHFSVVPLSELEAEEQTVSRREIDAMRVRGRIDIPDVVLPPPDEVVVRHIVSLQELGPRLSFEPVTPSIPGHKLLGALEVPNGPVDGLPSPPARLSSVDLVYRVGSGDKGPLIIVSEENLEDGNIWATVPAEAINQDVNGQAAVQRTLRGQGSGRIWNEVTFFDDRSSLLVSVGGYTAIPAVHAIAQAIAEA